MADTKGPKSKIKLTKKQQDALRDEDAKLTPKELEERIAPFRMS